MFKWVSIIAVLLSVCVPATAFSAKIVEAEGSAVIENGAVGKARHLAIQNAIRHALLQGNAYVNTSTLISEKILVSENTKISAMGMVRDVKVLSERIDERLIHVKIRAKVPEQGDKPESPASRYLKKVAAVQFHVMSRAQIHDVPHIESVLPRELMRSLEASGLVTTQDATQYGLWAQGVPGEANPDVRRMVSQLADQLGVQFIVAGVIRDMSLNSISLFEDARSIDVDVMLFDGVSGVQLMRQNFQGVAYDADYLEPEMSVGGAEFYRTSLGEKIKEMVDQQSKRLQRELALLPFTAKVIRSEGTKIYFNAGRTSLVEVGDVLMSYRLDPSPMEENSGHFLGYPETPVAAITVKQTQPLFAVGELESDEVKLAPGDVIRFGL